MSSEDEQQVQQHKVHKINKKLKKARKLKKEAKKLKTLKKKAYELTKDDKRSEFFAQRDKKKSKKLYENGSPRSKSQQSSSSSSPPPPVQQPTKPSTVYTVQRPPAPQIQKPVEYLTEDVYAKIAPQNDGEEQPKQRDTSMDDFLNDIFRGTQHKKQLSQFLDKRIRPPVEQKPQNPGDMYLGGTNKERMNQDQLQQYMEEWDSSNRGASLMEIHRQKMREERQLKGPTVKERKVFDRDTDLMPNHQSSKQVMTQIRRAGGSLDSKFSKGQVENQFM